MGAAMYHRGPDDHGVWTDETNGIALSHRRLSILDLSPLGHQPMQSASERYVIVFNGEIYNFKQLRQELSGQGHQFKGGSDTEVLLAAIEMYGINEAVKKCVGMFAFALWDKQQTTLYLCRDRMGEKPLYYGKFGNTFLFGSELKALKQHPSFEKQVDCDSVAQLLQTGYVAGPRSIVKNIHKLRPGCILSFQPATKARWIEQPYWSLKDVAERGQQNPIADTPQQAGDQLLILLSQIIRDQLVADVPVGAFLSGGVDSSTIVAMAQSLSSRPLKTFTIGFEDPEFNEADVARRIASHLKTDHTEMQVSAHDAQAVIPKLARMYDEPIADSSQIPTFLVSQLARQHVTVSLSGDGGDELFAGYKRYARGQKLWNFWRKTPAWMRAIGGGSISAMGMAGSHLTRRLNPAFIEKMSRVVSAKSTRDFYENMVSHSVSRSLVLNASPEANGIFPASRFAKVDHFTPQMQYLDSMTYLPDDILVKVDRGGNGCQPRITHSVPRSPVRRICLATPHVDENARRSNEMDPPPS